MEFIVYVILILFVLFAINILFMHRNNITYDIRTKLIENNFEDFDKFPSYGEMMYNPKYALIWSYDGWIKWFKNENNVSVGKN